MKIQLKSVKNIRDFSEFGHPDYIRSAHLHDLTPAEASVLRDRYGLRTIIDLRTSQEVSEKADATIPGVQYFHMPLFDAAIPGISHERETDEIMRQIPDMAEMYRLLVTEEPYLSQVRKVMAVINDPRRQGAVLWHCTEGKDRCGIISALFLLSRGVDPQKVMADYLRTNRANCLKAWKYYFLLLLAKRGRANAALVRDAFLAKRAYLAPIMARLSQLAADIP